MFSSANQLGVASHVFSDHGADVIELTRELAAAGVLGLEWNLPPNGLALQNLDQKWLELRRLIFGINAGSVLASSGPNLLVVNENDEQALDRAINQAIRLTNRLKSRDVVLPPATLQGAEFAQLVKILVDRVLDKSPAEDIQMARESLREVYNRHRDLTLECLARRLHSLTRQHPEVNFALVIGRSPLGFPGPSDLLVLCDEVRSPRLGFVRDVAVERARGVLMGESPDLWNVVMARTTRVYLSDCSSLTIGLPPGSGEVDWDRVGREFRGLGLPVILNSPGFMNRVALREAIRFLQTTPLFGE